MTFSRCESCGNEGPTNQVSRVRDDGAVNGGRFHHCLRCDSNNVTVFSEEGYANDLADREGFEVST